MCYRVSKVRDIKIVINAEIKRRMNLEKDY